MSSESELKEEAYIPFGIVSGRFAQDGRVLSCPGNTTICHIPKDSPIIAGLQLVYDTIKSRPDLSTPIRLLPPSSWHMTVLDGVLEKDRSPGMWPPGREDYDLGKLTEEVAGRLRDAGLGLEKSGLSQPYRMRVSCFGTSKDAIGIHLEGATEAENVRLRQLRDRLADAFGWKKPGHESYIFHITIAYMVRTLSLKEEQERNAIQAQVLPVLQGEFELQAVEFCTFEGMDAFATQFYLGA